MGTKTIWITERDKKRLIDLVKDIRELERTGGLPQLQAQLDQARVVAPNEIPEDVVTMNCFVRLLDTGTREETECWLRFSPDSRTASRVVPILSELGIALLGNKEGDIIEWSDQSGKRRSKILEIIFQPERLGNYEL
jgi:regulator of nucleoside diphosphate kinase